MLFAQRLKELRGEQSQQKFVDDFNARFNLDIKRSRYASWENGSEPSIEILKCLATYFNVSVDYLTGYVDYKNTEYKQTVVELGLSENALRGLEVIRHNSYESNNLIGVLDFLLTQELDEDNIRLSNLLELITGRDTDRMHSVVDSLPDEEAKFGVWTIIKAGLHQSAVNQIEEMINEWQRQLPF